VGAQVGGETPRAGYDPTCALVRYCSRNPLAATNREAFANELFASFWGRLELDLAYCLEIGNALLAGIIARRARYRAGWVMAPSRSNFRRLIVTARDETACDATVMKDLCSVTRPTGCG
jgi:hypothetical protein